MLIKTLDLRNFQTHKILSLKFSRFLTVIKGTSGVGKSAILRSLFQLIDEAIPWSVCQTWGTDNTSVRITGQAEGTQHTIERIRSSKLNRVVIDGTEYDYIGKDAPEKLSSLLNIKEQNIQKQKNHWFLIDMKPGQLSKELNSVSGLNIIDASVHEIQSRVRNAQTELRLLTGQAAVLEKEVQSLQYIESASIEYKGVEEAAAALQTVEDIQNALKYLKHQLNHYLEQKKDILPKSIEEDLAEVKTLYHAYMAAEQMYLECSAYQDTLQRLENSLVHLTQNQSTVESVFKELEASFCTYRTSGQVLNKLTELSSQLNRFLKQKEAAEQELNLAVKEQESIKICPTCGRPL